MKISARRAARELIVQALYDRLFSDSPVQEIEAYCLANAVYEKIDQDYFHALFEAILERLPVLDKLFEPYLDRSIDGLTPIELSILRLATYELSERLDIPYRVVINEALELTKTFGATEAFKFVNGVLDKVANQCRPNEVG